MKNTLAVRLVLVAILLGASLIPTSSVAAASRGLKPFSYITYQGSDSGAAVKNLSIRDQTGTQDDPAKYVAFMTPASLYRGIHKFKLPASIQVNAITSLKLNVNFKGPPKTKQTWTWALYDWNVSKWVTLGDNAKAAANTWSLLAFTATNPKRFVNPGTREIHLKLQSNNASGNAKIDFETIRIGYTDDPPPTGTGPTIAGCPVYPINNIWNVSVDTLPVHARSADWVNRIGANTGFHMDFGSGTWDGGPIGIPYNLVSGSQTKVNVTFDYAGESDKGPYPIPASPKIEHGSDHHILIVDKDNCKLYELYNARKVSGKWRAGSGAIWDLYSNALRPAGWTSADAAGLPILPGLVRYEEVLTGEINHAIRFTAPSTQKAYLWPARHFASDITNPSYPPMGARFRLKASYNISGFPPKMQVILRAMKKYGIILADNGSPWYVSGAPDPRWDNDMLHLLDVLKGSNFEAVDVSSLMQNPNSGATSAQSWQPPVGASWQIQFTGPIDPGINASIYDLDMFDTSAATVASLHSQGKKVICYISAGSWEDWRPDAGQFPAVVLGNDYDGWPGEKWLDIRRIDLLAPILRARLDLCVAKGFDGVDPDNLDGYTNNTGFLLTAQHQLKFNRWLSKEAHARGLAIGLKNDPDQVNGLLAYFDWALTEDCFDQSWCGRMSQFVNAGKPVFAIEYTDTGITLDDFCPQAVTLKFSAILKNRDLDAFRQVCP